MSNDQDHLRWAELDELTMRVIRLTGELAALRLRVRELERLNTLRVDESDTLILGEIHPPKDDNTE